MKKLKRQRQAEAPAPSPAPVKKAVLWWPWVAGLLALVLAFVIFGPALNGPFVLDDLYLPYANPQLRGLSFVRWITDPRPVLMASFWLNHYFGGDAPDAFHQTNVFLHVIVAGLAALIAMRLVEWAGAPQAKTARPTLGLFAGALFLVHPMQTESVAYVASRSDVLSTLFYYAAYCVFLYRRTESITIPRALAVLALFAAALGSKQHTLTLPLLMLLTDLFWSQGSVKANRLLYGMMAALGVAGGIYILRTLFGANTAGFNVAGLTPLNYFATECRVVWDYVRLFVLPIGQNADPDVAISHSLFEPGPILGLIAGLAVAGTAWVYRKRFPLASFGIFAFLLLIAPTSSFIPIQDVLQERRLYLPFIGLALICLEFLRRLDLKQRAMIEAPVLIVLMILTYQRSAVWGSSMALWQDTVKKSPKKVRPRFQLAEAYYDQRKYAEAAQNYEIASHLAPPDYRLLVNYGLALDQSGKHAEALQKLQQAATMERDPEVWTLIAQVYGEQQKTTEALTALNTAEAIDPNFEMTYAVRGNVYESAGDLKDAADQYQRALKIDPYNDAVRGAVSRVQREQQQKK